MLIENPIKIVRTDKELECPFIDDSLRSRNIELVLLPESINEGNLIEATQDVDLILMCYTPITARVINQASKLKGIVKYGVGIDAIDIDAAKAKIIPVVNVPEYAENTVAEGAFCLMIALAKRLVPIHNQMQSNGWAWPESRWLGMDLNGKILGLVGAGRIGQKMAKMAEGFGMRIIAYDPYVDRSALKQHGIEFFDELQQMLTLCDFVSVHCVLNPQTHHLIGQAEFACMKSSALFLNVSRGAITDESALLHALESKQIAGAGLDVYSQEPLAKTNHPLSALYSMDNVILMPHLTFYTHEAMYRLELETLKRCYEILEGQPVTIKSKDPRLISQSAEKTFIKK